MRSSANQSTSKDHSKKVSKSITLLKHTRDETSSILGTILEGGGSGVTVQTTHGNTEQSTNGKELFVILTETSSQFENDEQNVVDDEGPLSAVTICGNTEDG